jgi:AcrR family transcriptional regulator
VTTEPGLRERKKQRTRQVIADAAHRLFVERGFDAVTVAEVARAADVSEGTVFNYFPTKEELFYGQMETFEARLVAAVRERRRGESALAAFRRFMLEGLTRLESEEVAAVIETTAHVVTGSAALQAREREIVARYTEELAVLLAEETRAAEDNAEPLVVASALMAVHRALVAHVRRRVLAGTRGRKLADETRIQAKGAFARLERGLAGYAVKRR